MYKSNAITCLTCKLKFIALKSYPMFMLKLYMSIYCGKKEENVKFEGSNTSQ